MREYETGATRNDEEGKLDYEAFLSYRVLKRYAEYMNSHRQQADGNLREGDNWQKGIPQNDYMKSAWRHFMDLWEMHRDSEEAGPVPQWEELEETLCALLFNVMGYLHVQLQETK